MKLELPVRFDNLLRTADIMEIQRILYDIRIPWNIANSTISKEFIPEYDYDPRVMDSQSAIWMYYSDTQKGEECIYYKNNTLEKHSKRIAEQIAERLGYKILGYARIKANILFHDYEFTPEYFNCPHKDYEYNPDMKVISVVYYVDDSDGDTCVFTEFDKEKRTLGEPQRFPPIKGTAVALWADAYHASSNPVKHNRRTVINIVFQVEENNEESSSV